MFPTRCDVAHRVALPKDWGGGVTVSEVCSFYTDMCSDGLPMYQNRSPKPGELSIVGLFMLGFGRVCMKL